MPDSTPSKGVYESQAPSASDSTLPEHLPSETEIQPVAGDNPGHLPGAIEEIHTGISVKKAEADFAQLQRELSRISRAESTAAKPRTADVEKGGAAASSITNESLEPFDLEATLRGGLAAEQEAGIRPKHIGVYWDGLTIKGFAGQDNYVDTFVNGFLNTINVVTPLAKLLGFAKKRTEATLLDNFRGVCKPGEMVLVLGKPGSGCTTFLKSIANQRYGYTGVAGDVLYGPFTAKEFLQYRGEAVYNQEDDIHHPTLTVEQTLAFALDMKVPGKRPAGVSKDQFKEQVITTLLKMFNIEHTRRTVVGDHFIRGVSGGERKRVSIAEMMITNACILSWDNSTRGLDSSTALDFIKSLRIQTDLYQTTTFVSLYQASENIYKHFEKVLVIDGGKQVYFGPASDARSYFESLGFAPRPRQTTPDYLTGCTDEFERDYAKGYSKHNAPHDPATLAAAFKDSVYQRRLNDEMAGYKAALEEETHKHEDFRVAVHESKRSSPKRSTYATGFHIQVAALMKRQFYLKLQDKMGLTLSWLRSIVIAIVLGSLYLKLGDSSATFSELASTMSGRAIVNKHRTYAFHRPSALWIAQILVDQAFSATQIMVFSIIVYFMTGLYQTAGGFFTFYLMILSGNIAMTLFFRIVGCASPDYDTAIRSTVFLITCFVITSGYLIQYHSMMMNEFRNVDLVCSAESLIPSGPGYDDISHQVCTLAGSVGGTAIVKGASYITQGFSYDPAYLWRNWGIVMALIVFFLIMNVVLGEFISYGESVEESSDLTIKSESILTWEELNYDVPTPAGTKRLLNNIYGYVRPGELTALMGASGAGKTTLLDVLAARKNIGVISGSVLVDGVAPGKQFQRSTSYAEQLDLHDPTQTVREAFRFSADLRRPVETPQSDKYAYVEEIIALLEMEHIADSIIGTPEAGLTVEQRKRVTIGVELSAKPELLLFLDEPTSGLDSQSAFNIVRFLKKLAAAGQAILCTIHQPNAALFENFDRLLLLQRGGRTVYFGDIGADAHILRAYLKGYGAAAGEKDNVAEFMLEAIGAGSSPRVGNRDWADIWEDSPEFAQTKETIKQLKEERIRATKSGNKLLEKEYATPFLHQLKIVTARMNTAFWRSPNYEFTRLLNHLIVSLLTGLMYLGLDDSRSSLQYKVFVIFQVTVLPALIIGQVEVMYHVRRAIFFRESSSKMYSPLPLPPRS
ncbi:unnamed protein product [Parascedosporium putredinis]|uniref:ABC transporter domain-containing protein n=1 Tax=Parascedosporium putredinis TaxID=1442378 RepID=A0A9P1H3V1_9PEZI|nr:unnamed protein product [Parascedosporium putredinis]CAI7996102.1 unnamed protein product [Parascedosporium putredinis]